jgi:hypothetical protein
MELEKLAAVMVDRLHQAFNEETKMNVHLSERLRERLTERMTEILEETYGRK